MVFRQFSLWPYSQNHSTIYYLLIGLIYKLETPDILYHLRRKKIDQSVAIGSSYKVDLLEIGKKEVIIYGLLKEFQQETIVQVMISEVIKTSEIARMCGKGGYM